MLTTVKSKFSEFSKYLLTPFTKLSGLMTGLTFEEINKMGEMKQIVYTYEIYMNKTDAEVATENPLYDQQLHKAIEVTDVFLTHKEENELVYVEIQMETIITNEDLFKPLAVFKYPIYLALFYVLGLFGATLAFTYYLELNLNSMIYLLGILWVLVMILLYVLFSRRYILGALVGKRAYSQTELMTWFKENKSMFVSGDMVRENKSTLPYKELE